MLVTCTQTHRSMWRSTPFFSPPASPARCPPGCDDSSRVVTCRSVSSRRGPGAAVLTATALAATTRVLSAIFTGDDIAAVLRENLTALVVLALAASARYLFDAAARASAARLAPKAVREADLEVVTAATAAELVAYEDPDFEDAHAAASDGAEKTGDLILDAQLLTSAAAQMAAAATVVTVLHPTMLPLLVLSVIPCAWGAVRGARIEHATHHRNLADSRLRNVFHSYTTERNTADEVRAGTMADFLTRQYRIVSSRLETEQLKATRKALVVQGIGDALTAIGTAATWVVLVLLVTTGRMDLAVAGTAALAERTSGAAPTTTVRAGARLFRTSLSLDDWARFLTVTKPWTTRRGTTAVTEDGPQVITARGSLLHLPRRRHPRARRHRPGPQARRGHRPGWRERRRQEHPRPDPDRPVPRHRGIGAVGRNRPDKRRPRRGTCQGGARPAGLHSLAARRPGEHHPRPAPFRPLRRSVSRWARGRFRELGESSDGFGQEPDPSCIPFRKDAGSLGASRLTVAP